MALPVDWIWDIRRREYYYWCAQDSCFVYQNGNIVPYQQDTTESNYVTSDDSENYGLASRMNSASLQEDEESDVEPPVIANIEQGPADVLTETTAFNEGIRSTRRLRGSRGDYERLDRTYMIRRPGYDFFKIGKVFRCLWPEPTNMPDNNVTVVTGLMGEHIFAKIRWFVVIREGQNACTCLSIQTYGGQGVAKPSVIKSEHSIVHTIDQHPYQSDWERPHRNEEGMLPSICVVQTDEVERRMDPMSRINYGKPYTVEHNVKVFDFGQIHVNSINVMRRNFLQTWQIEEQRGGGSYLSAGDGESY